MPLALVISGEEQSVATPESKSVRLVCLHNFINIGSKKLCFRHSLELFTFYNPDDVNEALILPTDNCVLVQCCYREHVLLRLNAANNLEGPNVNHVDHLLLCADKK